jgi:hypothetical protein
MSGVQASGIPEPAATGATSVALRVEVVVIPVSDVDRARDRLPGRV